MRIILAILITLISFYNKTPETHPRFTLITPFEKSVSSGITSPEEVVRRYIDSRCSGDAKARISLTAVMPNDYLVAKKRGDHSILIPDIRSPEGLKSEAEILRPVYLNWLNFEVPKMICNANLAFGRIVDSGLGEERSEVTIEFQRQDGSLGLSWNFHLINSGEEGWKIYDIGPPRERMYF